ncbi:MAG: MBL fold metallo-hydrolase [Clostridia bacterium]
MHKRLALQCFALCAVVCFLCLPLGEGASAHAEICWNAAPPSPQDDQPLLKITFLGAWRSDCILLECGGERMMLDGGSDLCRDPLRKAMQAKDIRHFKYLLCSHYHEDHISGLYWLMYFGFTADEYLHPYGEKAYSTDPYLKKTVAQAKRAGIPIRQVDNGDTLTLGNAKLQLFRKQTGEGVNGKSLVVRVVFGTASAWFCADIDGRTQKWLLQNVPPDQLKTDVVKFPHHGISNMSPALLDAMSPELLVMTNLEKNALGGAPQAKSRKIPALFAGDGRVVLQTDGIRWYVTQEKGLF